MAGKFEIEWCDNCKVFFVRCPRCGNNTCSGDFGENGNCPVCPIAYEVLDTIQKAPMVSAAINKLLFADAVPVVVEAAHSNEKQYLGPLVECHCEKCEACLVREEERIINEAESLGQVESPTQEELPDE